jgi:hypothetical protein
MQSKWNINETSKNLDAFTAGYMKITSTEKKNRIIRFSRKAAGIQQIEPFDIAPEEQQNIKGISIEKREYACENISQKPLACTLPVNI